MSSDAARPASRPRAALVANPVKTDVERLWAAMRSLSTAHGWAAPLRFDTTPDDAGRGRAAEALAAGASLVVAAGGDGTVREVAEALLDEDAELGIVPAGTGNLLARNLGIPVNGTPQAALEAVFAGSSQLIDIGVAEVERASRIRERFHFTVLCGVGIDAQMIANTDAGLKRRVGWVAYVGGIARALGLSQNLSVRVRFDGRRTISTHANSVLIGNCGELPGGVLLMPEASITDGLLDVALLRPSGVLGWLQVWTRLLTQSDPLSRAAYGRKILIRRRETRALRYEQSRVVDVRLKTPTEFEVDGDAVGEVVAIHARVDDKALRVRVPQSPRGSAAQQGADVISRTIADVQGTLADVHETVANRWQRRRARWFRILGRLRGARRAAGRARGAEVGALELEPGALEEAAAESGAAGASRPADERAWDAAERSRPSGSSRSEGAER